MIVGFAGAGNMAAAMARGWAGAPNRPARMLFTDSGSGRASALAAELGGEACSGPAELAAAADLVVLAVKPAALDAVAPDLRGARSIVSVLGATPLARLRDALGSAHVLRCMPNVAVEVRRGVLCVAAPASGGDGDAALRLLAELGTVVELPEPLIDPATAVMGCSLAYLALACEALIEAGAEAGIPAELAGSLVSEAAAGTGELMLRHEPAAIRTTVASPGGSTEAGLEALERADVRAAFAAAVAASLERMAAQ